VIERVRRGRGSVDGFASLAMTGAAARSTDRASSWHGKHATGTPRALPSVSQVTSTRGRSGRILRAGQIVHAELNGDRPSLSHASRVIEHHASHLNRPRRHGSGLPFAFPVY